MTPVKLKPAAPWSRVKHSTTEPLPSPISNLKCISIHEDFVLANSVEPDEMPHFVAFHQDRHCLPK